MYVENSTYRADIGQYKNKSIEKRLHEIVKAIPDVIHYLENFTVHDGWLGVSLFYCFYARYTDQEIYMDEAAKYLNKALELTDPVFYSREYQNDSYDYRLASLGIFFRQVDRHGFLNMDGNDFLSGIDQTLAELARLKIARGDYSRFSGALASGYYFYYSNKNNPLRAVILEEIVFGLKATAKEDADGDLYWISPVSNDKIYFGPHGSAMIISFLAAVLEEGIVPGECREMIRKAAAFVLKHIRDQKYGLFPIYLKEVPGPTQFSQCYGDLGIGYALFKAARVLGDTELASRADHILSHCLDRKYEDGYTTDAGITYGAAGVSHLFGKLARLSNGDERFLNAESYWQFQIPNYAIFENEFAGFRSSLNGAPEGVNASFGWGIIGIGISLMRCLKPDLPHLDGFDIYI